MSKFDDIFNSNTLIMSDLMIQQLNKKLPKNVRYLISSDGKELYLDSTGDLEFSNFEFVYPKEFLKLNNNVKDPAKLRDYCQNAMINVMIKPKNNGLIKINGTEIDTKNFVLDQYGASKLKDCSIFFTPPPLKSEIKYTLKNKKYEKSIVMNQVPNSSITTTVYSYKERNYFRFDTFINNYDKKITFKFTSNMGEYPSIEIGKKIESLKESFIREELFLDNLKLNTNIKDKNYVNFEILEKMEEIEKKLKMKFTFPLENINNEDINNVLLVYASIIGKKSIHKSTIESLLIDATEFPSEEFINMENMALSFCRTDEIKICNNTIRLFGCYVYLNLSYSNFEKNGELFKVKMVESSEKGIIENVRYFISEEDFENEEKKNTNIRNEIMNAKPLNVIYEKFLLNKFRKED